MKDRFIGRDNLGEVAARFIFIPGITYLTANASSVFFLVGWEQFHRAKILEGAALTSFAVALTLSTGYTASVSVRGFEFIQEFKAMIQRPNRFR